MLNVGFYLLLDQHSVLLVVLVPLDEHPGLLNDEQLEVVDDVEDVVFALLLKLHDVLLLVGGELVILGAVVQTDHVLGV